MLSLLEVIKKTADFFQGKGVESPRLNAELLIGHALGLKRMQLYLQFERLLTEAELVSIRPLVRRRGQREPLQYILGTTDFSGLTLKVDRRALIPRPETEGLVEAVVERCKATPPRRILDLGTGTGAIALVLATAFPEAHVTALDASEDALALARENAEQLGLSTRVHGLLSPWYAGLGEDLPFDLIVSNPPYLTDQETAEAAPEVKDFEPVAALTSPDQGMADLKVIIRGAPARLAPGGLLALETGIAQHSTLLALLGQEGFARTESLKDLSGRDRYVLAWR